MRPHPPTDRPPTDGPASDAPTSNRPPSDAPPGHGSGPPGGGERDLRLCPVLIGRDDLIALARRRWTAAATGSGQLLLLAGEAGIGKTRLLREISVQATADGFVVVGAATFPHDAQTAGGVLFDLATHLRRRTEAALVAAGVRLAASLRDSPDEGGDAHRRRRLLVTGLAEALVSLADGPAPVLLALEDLHWADDLTLEVLDRLVRHLGDLRMLTIGTFRSDELYPKVPMRRWRTRWLGQRQAEQVRLARLDREQTSAMSTAITRAVLPAPHATALYERSDGVPLHVEELLAGGTDRVPDTLVDAVLTRAQALSGPAFALAGAAAVIGRSFDIDLVTAITDAPAQVVDAGLRELGERSFITARDDGSSYDFRHALIRDALYADLAPHRRRDLHARVATVAAAAGMRDAFISDQYERAHQAAPAYRHALAAATEAAAMSSHREAVELYRRAQRTTPADVTGAARAELLTALAAALAATDDNAAAANAYAEAYTQYRGLGDVAAAAAVVPDLVAVRHLLGAGLDERTTLLRDAVSLLPDPEASTQDLRARLLAALSAAYMLDRRLDEAITYGEQARRLATEAADQAALLNTDTTLGSVLVFAGRMEEGWQLLRDAIHRATGARIESEAARGYRMLGSCASVLVEYDLGSRWLGEGIDYAQRVQRWNDRHYMAAHLAHVRWATGDWPDAEQLARQAQADGQGGTTTRITALHVLGYLALGRGDWPAANGFLAEARALGEAMNELQRLSPALWGLAETALHSGQNGEAVRWCERGYAASARVRDAAYLFPYVVTGTRAYLRLGDSAGARDWVRRVEELLTLRGIAGTLPSTQHARGLLQLADGQTGKARESLTHASAAWDERHRFWEGTQALADLARCAIRSRRPAEAVALANRARERASAVGATTLLALLDAEAGPTGPAEVHTAQVHTLTARETEVARLVATGATNRQIAAALSIAPKTVAAHIEHILAKLGAARRTEIAAWAAARTSQGR